MFFRSQIYVIEGNKHYFGRENGIYSGALIFQVYESHFNPWKWIWHTWFDDDGNMWIWVGTAGERPNVWPIYFFELIWIT